MAYKVQPSDAMTELYGVGKGSAQVFDPNVALAYQKLAQDQQQHRDDQEARRQQKQDEKIQQGLEVFGDQIFIERDQQGFAEKQNEIKKYIYDNVDKLDKGDTSAWVDLNAKLSEYHTQAAQSNADRRAYYTQGAKITSQDDYYPEDIQAHTDYADPKNSMQFGEPPLLTKRLQGGLTKYVQEQDAREKTLASQDERHSEVTPQNVAKRRANDYSQNKQVQREVDYMMKNETNMEQYTDPITKKGLTDDDELIKTYPDKYVKATGENYFHAKYPGDHTWDKPKPNTPQWMAQQYQKVTDNPVTIKLNTFKVGGGVGESIATSYDNGNNEQKTVVYSPTTTGMRTMDGSVIPPGVKIEDFTFGNTANFLVGKKGSDLAGNIVTDETKEGALNNGAAEYVPLSFGTATYKVPDEEDPSKMKTVTKDIYQPATEHAGAIKKQGHVDLDDLIKRAAARNSSLKPNQHPSAKAEAKGQSPKTFDEYKNIYMKSTGKKVLTDADIKYLQGKWNKKK